MLFIALALFLHFLGVFPKVFFLSLVFVSEMVYILSVTPVKMVGSTVKYLCFPGVSVH